MNPKLGLQLWSVRNALQEDYVGTLEKVAAIGYQNLELITTVTDQGLIFGKDLTATQLLQHLTETRLFRGPKQTGIVWWATYRRSASNILAARSLSLITSRKF